MPSVLLATCAALPEADEDADLLLRALAEQGVDASWAVWTDPSVDWDAGLTVLRTTWDYTANLDAFLAWVGGLTRVANGESVVRWNSDKLYLRDLAEVGVPTVPTAFLASGQAAALFDSPAPGGVDEIVVKPSVGAGSRGAGRFTRERAAAAQQHVADLHAAGRTVMVQPYLAAVDTAGETSLIYVDGRFSHAIRKRPMLADGVAHPVDGWELYVAETIEARVPEPAELSVGATVMDFVRDRFGADQLYTRVDLLPSPTGPVLVELELTEPSLFLQYGSGDDEPAVTFAAAIAARA